MEQIQGLRQQEIYCIRNIEMLALPGKFKMWCLHLRLLPQMLWPLMQHDKNDVLISKVKKLEKIISTYIHVDSGWELHCILAVWTCMGIGLLELATSLHCYLHLDTLNIIEHSTCCIKSPKCKVSKSFGKCDRCFLLHKCVLGDSLIKGQIALNDH